MFFFVIILALFVFCYGRILIIIRRQAKVMAAHNTTGSNAKQIKANQVQLNIVKTMILVSAFYAVSNLPMHVYYLILNVNSSLTIVETGYYISLFVSFFYICTNPFIYAAKFDPVKRVLLALFPSRKTVPQQSQGPETQ